MPQALEVPHFFGFDGWNFIPSGRAPRNASLGGPWCRALSQFAEQSSGT